MLGNIENKARLIILTGPSGVGKDEVMKGVLKQGLPISRVVTYCADRGPRPGEVEGKHYHFISQEKFFSMRENGEFFEDNVIPGVIKGTGWGEVEKVRKGENLLWKIDPDRAARIKTDLPEKGFGDLVPRIRTIYLGVPTIRELWRRINIRQSDESKEKRIERLISDWEIWTEHKNDFDVMVMNETDKLDETIEKVTEFIRGEIRNASTS